MKRKWNVKVKISQVIVQRAGHETTVSQTPTTLVDHVCTSFTTKLTSLGFSRVQNVEDHVHGIWHKFDVRISSSATSVLTE